MVVGVLAIGQTLVILTAGIDLSCGTVMALGQIVMTKLAVASGVPALPAILLGDPDLRRLRRPERRPGDARSGCPPFIVTLGTLNIAFALTHIVLERRRPSRACPSALLFFGRTFTVGGRRHHLRRRVHARAVRARLVRAHADRLGPPRLRRRQQPRGGAADRHQHGPRAAQRLRARRAHVGIAALLLVGAHGGRRSERGADDREPRQHHRRRARRHEPVRRARQHHRHADRRA